MYRDGGLMMEVYGMDKGDAYYVGTQPCNYDLSKMQRLESPWREVMETRRRNRLHE